MTSRGPRRNPARGSTRRTPTRARPRRGRRPRTAVDDLDVAIIRALQLDGRASLRQVSRRVRASVTTISTRVRELRRLGVLQGFVPLLSVQRLARVGRAPHCIVAYVEPTSTRPEVVEAVANALGQFPAVCYVFEVGGNAPLMALASTTDQEEAEELISELRALPRVARVQVLGIERVHKERPGHPIGPRHAAVPVGP